MAVPNSLVTSDLHMELGAWKSHPGLWGDSYFALQQIADAAIETGVEALFLLGDVFNVKLPDPHTVSVMCREVQRLQDAGVAVQFLQGQHELFRGTAWMQVHPWPSHAHRQVVQVGEVRYYGLDWLPQGKVQEELKKVPREAQVLLMHQVWKEMWNSQIVPGECSFHDVPKHVRLLVSGDYHKHHVYRHRRPAGDLVVGSPGATCLQAINEEPEKAVFLVNEDLTLTTRPLRSRKVFAATAGTQEALDYLVGQDGTLPVVTPQAGVPEHISTNIIRVSYDEDLPEAHDRLVAAFRGKAHLFLDPYRKEDEKRTVEREARRRAADGGLPAVLDLVVPPGSPVNGDVRRLLDSPDPASEIDMMAAEFVSAFKRARQRDPE